MLVQTRNYRWNIFFFLTGLLPFHSNASKISCLKVPWKNEYFILVKQACIKRKKNVWKELIFWCENSWTFYRWSWHGFKMNFKLDPEKSRDLMCWSFVTISTVHTAYIRVSNTSHYFEYHKINIYNIFGCRRNLSFDNYSPVDVERWCSSGSNKILSECRV